MALRVGELAFAATVVGLVGSYLHAYKSGSGWPLARFIYIEIIAGLSILFALLWLLPFAGGFFHWPVDLLLAFAWFAAFALLVNYVDNRTGCSGSTFHWGGITHGGFCGRWRASEAFSFLSALFWLASALVGLWFIRRERRKGATPTDGAGADGGYARRGPWYRRSRV